MTQLSLPGASAFGEPLTGATQTNSHERAGLAAADMDAIVDQIGAAICSPPDHSGPCANPWSITSAAVDDLDDDERSTWLPSVNELLEQRRAGQQQ